MTTVRDEGAATPREVVTYTRTSPGSAGTTCSFPQRCVRRGQPVVRSRSVSQGEDFSYARTAFYAFEDPRSDQNGRGFLGFGAMRVWDAERGSETITTFDHASTATGTPDSNRVIYPFAGRPKTVTEIRPILSPVTLPDGLYKPPKTANARVKTTTYSDGVTWTHPGKTFFVPRESWTSLEWEEEVAIDWDPAAKVHITGLDGGAVLRTRAATYRYDDYGNVTHETVTTDGGVRRELHATYEIRANDWLVGLRTREEVMSAAATDPPPTPRVVASTYDARGFLEKVEVQPEGSDNERLTVTLARNEDGLVVLSTSVAAGEAPRTVHTTFDVEGVFPTQVWNSLQHSTWMLFHRGYGKLLAAMDSNGVQTHRVYDDLGRPRTVTTDGAGTVAFSYGARIKSGIAGTTASIADFTGSTVTLTFDEQERRVERSEVAFDGQTIVSAIAYDLLGRMHAVTRPGFGAPAPEQTVTWYDTLDRPVEQWNPDATTIIQQHTFFATERPRATTLSDA